VSVDPTRDAGRGPGGRAWRSGEIAVTNAWLLAFRARPWQSLGEKLKFRSSAAVPLLDETGRSIAMLSLYSRWPGFFSTPPVRSFLMHAQQVLSHAVQRCTAATVVPLRDQQRYRRLLDNRKVVMHYQPIIGMGDGGLVKFEALARLQGSDGKLIPPGLFLPALGRNELLALFAQGLEQACNDYLAFADEYPDSAVAINLPPEGLGDPRYEAVLFETIARCGLDSTRLHVEVLETQDAGVETAIRKPFLDRLRQAGIKITQDDLGSGHSSLLRLEKLPFDEVKIDQGLVRGALRNPKRAVQFILYLTRLAHAFNIPVTVEGLENHGLLEAAEILGADHGQGYGVARPMPAHKMAAWCRNYQYPVRPQRPVTAIGAMAGYLLWDLQITGIADKPELVSEFVGARAIVDHFIDANRLRGGAIDRLVSESHELIASAGKRDGAARDRVIGELTRFWLDETSPAGAH